MDILAINCWVRGKDAGNIFEVKISKTDTVATLKDTIKNIAFPHVVAYTLDLYKPRHPIPRPYKENLSKTILSEHGELLEMGDDELSEVFQDRLPKRHIHIIVDTPYPRIFYWFRGADISLEGSVEIQSNKTISAFKEQLTNCHIELRDTPTACIRIYRILEDNIEEYLVTMDEGKPLNGRQKVSDCFMGIPVLQMYCVVIQLSDANPIPKAPRPPPASNQVTVAKDLVDEGDPIKVARSEFLKSRPPRAPSDASHPSSFRGPQRSLTTQIRCGRPRDPEETIPATLLHPAFGQFLDDCKNHSIVAEDNVFVARFANAMSDVYDNEKERVDKVNAVLSSYEIGLRVTAKKGTQGYQVDGDLSVGEYRYVIAEFKNEAAASVSEPYMQAAAYYLERTRTQAPENTGSPLPCFILALFGPYIHFAGAVWNLHPAVQILSNPLALNYHSTDTDTQITVARHMAAFRKAVRSLKQYYEVSHVDGVANSLSHPSLFPYPTSYISLADNSKRTFHYRKRVKDDHKLLFYGTLVEDSGTEVPICIKFSRRYSRGAHWRCAQLGIAPTLRGCEEIPGGWFMVVMDELVGYKSLDELTNPTPKSAFDELYSQLNQLHHDGFVHGDLRDVNIMVRAGEGATFQFMIIDFDWAGEINVARYPPYVNRSGIGRPGGAIDGELILAAHDHWMLNDVVNNNGK